MKSEPKYFTAKQFNQIANEAAHAIVKYKKERKLIDKSFRSQIMLTVSKVNSCNICSYMHTKSYIKSGASDEELQDLLDGDFAEENYLALVFAQHYADLIGNYDKEAFNQLVEKYGQMKAFGIMATIKIIMFGNSNGIALTNFFRRLRFKKATNSKLSTELHNGFLAYFIFPFFLIINIFKKREPYIY